MLFKLEIPNGFLCIVIFTRSFFFRTLLYHREKVKSMFFKNFCDFFHAKIITRALSVKI